MGPVIKQKLPIPVFHIDAVRETINQGTQEGLFLVQHSFRLFTRGNIPGAANDAVQLSIRAVNAGRRRFQPEKRTVFAQPPPFQA